MRQYLIPSIAALTLLTVPQPRAQACLWDRELVAHEKQFKSSYLEQPAQSSPGDQNAWWWLDVVAFGGGVLMMVAMGLGVGVEAVRFIADRRQAAGGEP